MATLPRRELQIDYRAPGSLTPAPTNPRKHTAAQIQQLADSIERFGFAVPILVTEGLEIVAGHGCWMAAKRLKLDSIPCVTATDWTEEEIAAYRIADNQLGMNSAWDFDALLGDVGQLESTGFDLDVLGFDSAFVGQMLASLDDLDALPAEGLAPPTGDAIDGDAPDDLWEGVDGHEADEADATYPEKSMIVHFTTNAAIADFAKALGIRVSPTARSIWYPMNPNAPITTASEHWVADED